MNDSLSKIERSHIIATIAVILLSSFFFVYRLDYPSIRETDESTHVRVIQEMYNSGNYFKPTLDGEPYNNKPPFKMWLTIGLIELFGESVTVFRIIDGLSGIGVVVVTLLLGQAFFGSFWIGFVSALLLLSSPGFLFRMRFLDATQDALMNFLFVFALYWAVVSSKSKRWCACAFVYGIIIGCGFLTKLVAILPTIPLAIFYFYQHEVRWSRILQYLIISALVSFGVIAIFYVPRFLDNPDLFSAMYAVEINDRLLDKGYHNVDRWWLYLHQLFVLQRFYSVYLLVPALGFSLIVLGARFKDPQTSGLKLLLLWAIGITTLYSIAKSRVPYYIAPVLPALALLCGYFLWSCWMGVKSRKLLPTVLSAIVFIFLAKPVYSQIKEVFERKTYKSQPSKKPSKAFSKISFDLVLSQVKRAYLRDRRTRFMLFRMQDFLRQTGNNAWRHKAHVQMAHPKSETLEDLQVLATVQEPFYLLLPQSEVPELLNVRKPCEQFPLEAERNVRPNRVELNPRKFLLLRYDNNC